MLVRRWSWLLAMASGFATSCGRSELADYTAPSAGGELDGGARPECVTTLECVPDDLCSPRRCVAGTCVSEKKACDDGDPCTGDVCSTETGKCVFGPLAMDHDGDGYTGPLPGFASGAPGACGDDCDDTSAWAHPGGNEVCDGVDNDCNGIVDDGSSYVPSGVQDVRVSHLEQAEAIRGGLVSNGSVFVAAWTAIGPTAASHALVTQLAPSTAVVLSETQMDSVSGFAGPIVWTGSAYGAVWRELTQKGVGTHLNVLDPSTAMVTPGLDLESAVSNQVDLTWNGADFLLVWDEHTSPWEARVRGRRVAIDGSSTGDPANLTEVEDRGFSPRLARGIKTVAVAFEQLAFPARIAMRTFSPDLQSPSALIQVADEDAVAPALVFNKDRYVIAYGKHAELPGDSIWGAAVDEAGNVLFEGKKLTSGASFARTPWLLPLGDRLVMIWADDHDGNYELYIEMLSPDLEVIRPRERITFDGANSMAPAAALGKDGELGVLFEDDRSGSWQVYFNHLACVPE